VRPICGRVGIDSKLAWKISRFVTARTVRRGPLHSWAERHEDLPACGRATARRAEVISAAEKAFAAFRSWWRHAGNRKYFDMMVAAHATADRGSSDLEHRRLTFEGTASCGVCKRAQSPHFRGHRPRMGVMDTIAVRGFIDFRAMRPGVAWRICAVLGR